MTNEQTRNALIAAMDSGRAFSWLKSRDVQTGVYLKYTQQHFQTYMLKRAA